MWEMIFGRMNVLLRVSLKQYSPGRTRVQLPFVLIEDPQPGRKANALHVEQVHEGKAEGNFDGITELTGLKGQKGEANQIDGIGRDGRQIWTGGT